MINGTSRFGLSIGLILALLSAASVEAIIIRHDRNYAGYRVREIEFPALFFLDQQANRKICVATLIDPGWAITAAHCVAETPLRETHLGGTPAVVSVAGADRVLDQVVLHPDYIPGAANEVDLALLKFETALGYPRPVALNRGVEELGRVVDIVGWGYFGIGTVGRQYSDGALRRARNRIEVADRRLLIRFDDPREQAGKPLDLEGMPGLGDSGGPALLATEDGWLLAGVAVGELDREDFSEESQGVYGAEAVYERVSRHLDWIGRTIAQYSPVVSE